MLLIGQPKELEHWAGRTASGGIFQATTQLWSLKGPSRSLVPTFSFKDKKTQSKGDNDFAPLGLEQGLGGD